MDLNFLDFEQPIAELEAKIDELRFVGDDSQVNISEEIDRLKSKSESLTRSIFSNLSAWQIAQLARHPQRPHTLDYVEKISPDFQELHGDRMFADERKRAIDLRKWCEVAAKRIQCNAKDWIGHEMAPPRVPPIIQG